MGRKRGWGGRVKIKVKYIQLKENKKNISDPSILRMGEMSKIQNCPIVAAVMTKRWGIYEES